MSWKLSSSMRCSTYSIIIMSKEISLALCSAIGVVMISIYILFLMIIRWQFIWQDRVELRLVTNTFKAGSEPMFFVSILTVFSICGYTHETFVFEGWPCLFIAVCAYTGGFVYFNSFLLQSIYRYFRVVFCRTYTIIVKFHQLIFLYLY